MDWRAWKPVTGSRHFLGNVYPTVGCHYDVMTSLLVGCKRCFTPPTHLSPTRQSRGTSSSLVSMASASNRFSVLGFVLIYCICRQELGCMHATFYPLELTIRRTLEFVKKAENFVLASHERMSRHRGNVVRFTSNHNLLTLLLSTLSSSRKLQSSLFNVASAHCIRPT